MKRFLTHILLCLATVSAALAIEPSQMPDVQKGDSRQFVSDPAGLLSPRATREVNARLEALRRQTSAEMAVAIPPSLGDVPIEEWSEQLFTLWGLGKADNDNGVLLVVSPESRRARIQTGYGMEGILPDVVCLDIINRSVVPAMKEGDLDQAVTGATAALCSVIEDPSVREEILSRQSGPSVKTLSADVLWEFLGIVAFVAFMFALVLLCYDLRHLRGRSNYDKALRWRRQLPLYWYASAFSLGTALPLALIALWLSRSYRSRPIKCDTCGHKMRKLPEDKDNDLLSDSQDFEERLKTVDYDVWECPQCGTVERFPFREKQMKYTQCERCGTIAKSLKYERTVVPATTRQAGRGEKVYECQFCHNQTHKDFVIPKKVDEAALAAAAAAAAMSSRRRGGGWGGGGGFGGGFGGGSTGGGGASGGW